MPVRSQERIRRDINRLKELIEREKDNHASLKAILPNVISACDNVNKSWQLCQQFSTKSSESLEDRDKIVNKMKKWIQRWRPTIFLKVPGTEKNKEALPSRGNTHDDTIRVVEDMIKFISENEDAASFREEALTELGTELKLTKEELKELRKAIPTKANAKEAFSKNCVIANTILVRALQIVRSIFGRTSPEYKQFIKKSGNDD